MRATLSVPAARDPEVLERLDSTALCNLCHLYQKCLNKNAVDVCTEQDKLSKRVMAVSNQFSQFTFILNYVIHVCIDRRLIRNLIK